MGNSTKPTESPAVMVGTEAAGGKEPTEMPPDVFTAIAEEREPMKVPAEGIAVELAELAEPAEMPPEFIGVAVKAAAQPTELPPGDVVGVVHRAEPLDEPPG